MTIAAIYARYSSYLQNPASIEDQVRTCQAFIASRGWTPAGPFTDHGLSRADPRRPGFRQLLQAIDAGEVQGWWPRRWTASAATRSTSPACSRP
ncbi:DNA invertase Pin-like site-specific DNA recombinase [Roseospira visakhapatnamensis]|uniref:DNA invertase Pin-like site-specific DNA recombinase n=1 Tax=Roseospira visakhapatnamensis TaxID=390880 RepID=A0A7W6WB59_9PROT|nr:DNA invertase Pin-like site-specific DNA recombinase [Roseospira visakhapatnamensis]